MTTEHDHEIMERLLAAIRSGEVHDDATMAELCRRLGATEAHCFAVIMTLGGRWPWRRVE
jgi:hypothetical protein